MFSKKLSILLFVVTTFVYGLDCYAETVTISCDNEKDDSVVGETYLEVEGGIDLDEKTSIDLTLTSKKVTANGKNEILGILKAKSLKYKKENDYKSFYSFDGNIKGEKYKVDITINQSKTRGISYGIKVNNQNLAWCAPAR